MEALLRDEWLSAIDAYRRLLGYAPGERISTPEAVSAALAALAGSYPDTCWLETYGHSVEGRPLQLLVIASPANLRNLDDIRRANRAPVESPGDAAALLEGKPATVWVIANVHGDEFSTAEAAVALGAWLAPGTDPALENVVVCIDPCQNPDGRARSVSMHYSLFGLKPRRDPNAAEHWDAWGGGRGNHYLFDMNRDWFPMTQPESRARVEAFLQWRPQIVADLHEMWWDSSYFFPPPANPVNPHMGPHIVQWWKELGREIAQTFDSNGWDYWTGEMFDAFFPGYGEAFPCIHGAVGMTFEQASSAGLEVRRQDGTLLTYEHGIRQHFSASLTVCRAASSGRERLLAGYREYFGARDAEPEEGPAAFVFPDARHGGQAEALARLLIAQGIVVERIASDCQTECEPYEGGPLQTVTLRAGAAVVRLDQPEHRAARAVLERETAIDPAWLAEQVRRLNEHVDPEFYDHTAWALPLAQGVACLTTRAIDLPLEPWRAAEPVAAGPAHYGWVIPADGMGTLRAVCDLQRAGARVHVAQREFTLDGVTYARGALVVKRADQPVPGETIAAALGPSAVAVESATTDSGITLGSDHVSFVKPPRIAALYGEPTASLMYGWLAYLFEHRLELPFTPVRREALKQADLRDYDVIILPHGRKENYAAQIDADLWTSLREWVRQGGTLIAVSGAAACIAEKGKDWTTCRVVTDLREPSAPEQPEKAEKDSKAEKEEKDRPVPPEYRPAHVTGAALRVALDRHHWTTLGFGEESHVPVATDLLLTPSVDGRNVAVFAPEDRLVLSGFVWDRMRPALAGKPYLVDETLGRGHLLLFADDPNLRGYWDVSSRLFVNAVLFGPR